MKTKDRNTNRHSLISSYWSEPIDRFLTGELVSPWTYDKAETIPAINIREKGSQYLIEMAVPGVKKEDLLIEVEGDVLTISCESKPEQEALDGKYTTREYNYDQFSRPLSLPDDSDSSSMRARYADGILSLVIPRKESAGAVTDRRINVE